MPEVSQLNHAPEVYSSIWHFLFLSIKAFGDFGDADQFLVEIFPSCTVKQHPAWAVPSVSLIRQQLTKGKARLSAGSKLFLR